VRRQAATNLNKADDEDFVKLGTGDSLSMAKSGTKRLGTKMLQESQDYLAALQAIPQYAPVNPRYAKHALTTAQSELNDAQRLEAEANAAAANAREDVVMKEWELHNLLLGARDQVCAQFGRDSNEAEAVGIKRRKR
jgi:heterodisulfide reductase subunit A-like polyferredoxin